VIITGADIFSKNVSVFFGMSAMIGSTERSLFRTSQCLSWQGNLFGRTYTSSNNFLFPEDGYSPHLSQQLKANLGIQPERFRHCVNLFSVIREAQLLGAQNHAESSSNSYY
jgi:hypothetical protein